MNLSASCRRKDTVSSQNGTNGSIANIGSIRDGDLDLGVVESDWQYHAYNG